MLQLHEAIEVEKATESLRSMREMTLNARVALRNIEDSGPESNEASNSENKQNDKQAKRSRDLVETRSGTSKTPERPSGNHD